MVIGEHGCLQATDGIGLQDAQQPASLAAPPSVPVHHAAPEDMADEDETAEAADDASPSRVRSWCPLVQQGPVSTECNIDVHTCTAQSPAAFAEVCILVRHTGCVTLGCTFAKHSHSLQKVNPSRPHSCSVCRPVEACKRQGHCDLVMQH